MRTLTTITRAFKPEDGVTIGFLIGLTGLLITVQEQVPSLGTYFRNHALMIGLYLLFLWLHHKSKTRLTRFARHWYPVFLFPVVYHELEPIIHVLIPRLLDPVLIDIDRAVFGVIPNLWLERIVNPWLTEILQVAYSTYYYVPTFLGIFIYAKGWDRAYHDLLLTMVLCIYGSFVGFLLVPTLGPRFHLAHQFTVPLEGKFLAPLVTQFMDIQSIEGGAFPSAHCAVALLTLVFSYRYVRPLFYIALPLMIGLFFSTVYGRYHYVVDVAAGMLLGGLAAYVSPKINSGWQRRAAATPS
ncbi:MAG: phosphatase PAP2 family protein [bacterium]